MRILESCPPMCENPTNLPFKVAALYKFATVDDPPALQAEILAICQKQDLKGTILVAHEGINGTVSGHENDIDALVRWLRAQSLFGDIDVKYAYADECPFLRMKVRLKKEIVTLGVEGVDPARQAGTYVDPENWNDLIAREDVTLIDTRNDYEVGIGTFEGAVNPKTESFRELPDWLDDHLDEDRDTPIAMFCTGGIRCEKSTALLRARGYRNIFHLKGGILNYLETVPEEESAWEGECFVFDNRVSVTHDLETGSYDLCHACRRPISDEDKQDERYEKGVSCPNCFDQISQKDRARFAERQRQIEIAEKQNRQHLAVNVGEARAAKRKRLEEQKERSRQSQS